MASATKATQDASGNVITSTYETKTDASSKLTEAKTYTDTVASGKADTSHTHSYAGSSSVGGAATSANKLNTNAGDANTPVYFSGGVPVVCTSLDLSTTGNAATAKVVSMSNYTLVTGGVVTVKFTYAVPANSTMNINSKGAKDIYHKGAEITANVIQAGDTASFMYDGTRYQLMPIDKTYSLFSSDISPIATGVINWTYG